MKASYQAELDQVMARARNAHHREAWGELDEIGSRISSLARGLKLWQGVAKNKIVTKSGLSDELIRRVVEAIPPAQLETLEKFKHHEEAGQFVLSAHGRGYSIPLAAYATHAELRKHCPISVSLFSK